MYKLVSKTARVDKLVVFIEQQQPMYRYFEEHLSLEDQDKTDEELIALATSELAKTLDPSMAIVALEKQVNILKKQNEDANLAMKEASERFGVAIAELTLAMANTGMGLTSENGPAPELEVPGDLSELPPLEELGDMELSSRPSDIPDPSELGEDAGILSPELDTENPDEEAPSTSATGESGESGESSPSETPTGSGKPPKPAKPGASSTESSTEKPE